MTKQSTKKPNHRRKLIGTLSALLLLAVLYFWVFGISLLEVRALSTAYHDLPIPASWKSEYNSTTPQGIFSNCASYPDVDCPSIKHVFSISSDSYSNTITSMTQALENKGYTIDSTCPQQSDVCKRISLNAHKGKVSVAVLVVNDSNSTTANVQVKE